MRFPGREINCLHFLAKDSILVKADKAGTYITPYPMKMNVLLFTDLDGTLLDAETYSAAKATAALQFLRQKEIPVIPCTSKTAEEVKEIRQKLHLDGPFIVENGSAIFWPEYYFKNNNYSGKAETDWKVTSLGKPYATLLTFFEELRRQSALPLLGFHEADIQTIRNWTGLSGHQANLAKKRQFSEPFIVRSGDPLPENLFDYARQKGYRILRGNRFYHLLSNTDKGRAVRTVADMYRQNGFPSVQTMGIGDSPNDFAMLQAVDIPVLVKKADGSYAAGAEHIPRLWRSRGVGPEGWQESIFRFIK